MNTAQVLALASIVLGALGTWLIYKGSYAFVQVGMFALGPGSRRKVDAGNQRRKRLQRTGIALFLLAQLLQSAAIVVG